MATKTSSGNGLAALVLVVVTILGVGWFMGNEDDGIGIVRPEDINPEDYRKVTLVVLWSRPVEREVTTTYWINGERHAGLQEESAIGQWDESFGAQVGDVVRLLAENVASGGRLSCHMYEATRDGNDVLVKQQIRLGDAGDCGFTRTVGDPPDVELL